MKHPKIIPEGNLLWIDQYGTKVFARNRKELLAKCYGKKATKVYRDVAGRVCHTGYQIKQSWFDCYAPIDLSAK